ncbi:hypothetical protein PRK78_003957 [Emydomyces testavorans]|uniref:Uncharacterized protein n=1 Tax=Emydomyces testavorans TaxID=2070801 RepID=A0AAF0DHU5_9EURO|nr:hypothetical protein PRK78_003957 [Emydomyces testavorans]
MRGDWLANYIPYYAKYAKPGDKTYFQHIDLNVPSILSGGRGMNMIQGSLTLTPEMPGDCTQILPGMHRKVGEMVGQSQSQRVGDRWLRTPHQGQHVHASRRTGLWDRLDGCSVSEKKMEEKKRMKEKEEEGSRLHLPSQLLERRTQRRRRRPQAVSPASTFTVPPWVAVTVLRAGLGDRSGHILHQILKDS